MSLKINPIVATLLIAGILILVFLLIKGCNQSNLQLSKFNKVDSLNNVLLHVVSNDKLAADSTKSAFQDSLEFERGQNALIKSQKERTESELQTITKANRVLIDKHKWDKYADTTAVTVPGDFISDCEGCFTTLEKTTNLVERYKTDINNLQNNWDKQSQLYQKRFKELDAEKLGFYNKINTLAKEQQKVIDALKPHGRLYLSWGVMWGLVPKMAGAGLLYQNKYNLLIGAKWYYGANGHMIETTLNFPLSIKFR